MGAGILVVDDEEVARALYTEEFRDEGYRVTSVAKASEALEAVRNNAVDLMVTDVRMPDINGNVLVSMVRAIRPDLPIVVVTASEGAEETLRGRVEGFFGKPVNLTLLKLKISDLLRPPVGR